MLKNNRANVVTTRARTPGKKISFPDDKSSENNFTKFPTAKIPQQLMIIHRAIFFMQITLEISFFKI
jgi:hypothetical protein